MNPVVDTFLFILYLGDIFESPRTSLTVLKCILLTHPWRPPLNLKRYRCFQEKLKKSCVGEPVRHKST